MIVQCRVCHKDYDIPITGEQIDRWNGGGLIQNVAPELTPGQRELLISNTCEKCFDEMFAEEDER
jgi:hypothetical protein